MKNPGSYAIAAGIGLVTGIAFTFSFGLGAFFGALAIGTASATSTLALVMGVGSMIERLKKNESKIDALPGNKFGKYLTTSVSAVATVVALGAAFKAVNGHELHEPEAWTDTPAVQKDLEEVCKRPSIKSMTVEGSIDGKEFTFTCPKK